MPLRAPFVDADMMLCMAVFCASRQGTKQLAQQLSLDISRAGADLTHWKALAQLHGAAREAAAKTVAGVLACGLQQLG